MEYILPTFLIPGAAKSGTTYLAKILSSHPDVFMPLFKEPWFFCTSGTLVVYHKGLDYYQRFFFGYGGQKHIGEASMGYMCDPDSPRLIHRHIPNIKLIFILRNPIDRLYSGYWEQIKQGRRLLNFNTLLFNRDETIEREIYISRYDIHLKRYFELFSRKQILVLLHDDLKRNHIGVINTILSFLELQPFLDETNLNFIANPSTVPRSRTLSNLIFYNKKLFHFVWGTLPPRLNVPLGKTAMFLRNYLQKPFKYPDMDEEARGYLLEKFREPISNLSSMLKRDFSHWH